MRPAGRFWPVTFVLGVLSATAPGETVTIQGKPAVADKGVTTGDFKNGLKPHDPDGRAATLRVSQLVWYEMQQALVRIDLADLPKDQQLRKATLSLNVAGFDGEPTKVRLCSLPAYDPWDERTATWAGRDGKQRWSGDGEVRKSIWRTLGSQTVDQPKQWRSFDVTEIVRDWYVGRVANTGFLLQPDYPVTHWGALTNSPGKVAFRSSEAADSTLGPKLVVELEPLPAGRKPAWSPPAPTTPGQLLRMPDPPYVIWYQCPYLDDLKHCNVDASVGTMRWAFENHYRGITSLMWSYGPNSPDAKDARYYVSQYSAIAATGYAGTAVDEWNVRAGTQTEEWTAEGMRKLKKDHPDCVLAVWVTGLTPTFMSLMKDGTIDLCLIEGYTFVPEHPEWAINWDDLIAKRVELMKREGLLPRTIVCLGFILAEPDSKGQRMTPEELTRQVEHLAKNYPEIPGIAYYGGYNPDRDKTGQSRELVLHADRLAAKWYPRAKPVE